MLYWLAAYTTLAGDLEDPRLVPDAHVRQLTINCLELRLLGIQYLMWTLDNRHIHVPTPAPYT